MSIKGYQTCNILMLYASLNAIPNPKTGTNSNDSKVGIFSIETLRSKHHSVDMKHYLFCVEFEVWFVIYFTRKFHVQ
jgi:hypothetical protein